MDDDDDFAGRSRLRCAPTECNHDAGRCWVVWGGLAFCETATTRCKHCHGRIRIENWLTPFEDSQRATKARQSRALAR